MGGALSRMHRPGSGVKCVEKANPKYEEKKNLLLFDWQKMRKCMILVLSLLYRGDLLLFRDLL